MAYAGVGDVVSVIRPLSAKEKWGLNGLCSLRSACRRRPADSRRLACPECPATGTATTTRAVCEDIMNFVLATASARESMGNLLSRKADLLAQTALTRHRSIGGHAHGPRMALRQSQFLGHLGAGPKEHLVWRLPAERWMRHLRVVLVDMELDHRTNPRGRVQGVQEQLLMLQRTPIRLDKRVGRSDLDLGEDAVQACRGQDGIHCPVHVLDAGIRI
jgi:hypothetical protein